MTSPAPRFDAENLPVEWRRRRRGPVRQEAAAAAPSPAPAKPRGDRKLDRVSDQYFARPETVARRGRFR